MNEYCKDVLMHAWGSSPERKALEKDYNAKYYSRNRNKLLQRALDRKRGLLKPKSALVRSTIQRSKPSDVGEIMTAPMHLYDGPDDFNESAKEGFKGIKKILSYPMRFVKSQADASLQLGKDFAELVQNTAQPIKNAVTKAATAVKDFFKKLKYYATSDFN